jgi:hypothetical protein
VIRDLIELTLTIAGGTILGTIAANRGTQHPGRHRDHGHTGATHAYATQLHSWNQRRPRHRNDPT